MENKEFEYTDELLNIPISQIGKTGIAFEGRHFTLLVHLYKDKKAVFTSLEHGEDEWVIQNTLTFEQIKELHEFLGKHLEKYENQ